MTKEEDCIQIPRCTICGKDLGRHEDFKPVCNECEWKYWRGMGMI